MSACRVIAVVFPFLFFCFFFDMGLLVQIKMYTISVRVKQTKASLLLFSEGLQNRTQHSWVLPLQMLLLGGLRGSCSG